MEHLIGAILVSTYGAVQFGGLILRRRTKPEAIRDLMTIDDFRRIALSMPGAEESSGLGYPNFRAERKSFATVEDSMAVLRLTRDQQATFIATAPEMFTPASSGWGRLGSTIVRLEAADEAMLRDALATAWRNVTNATANVVKIADAFKVADAAGIAKVADVGEIVAKVANRDDPGAVSHLAADGTNVGAVSVGDAVDEAHVADIGAEVSHAGAVDVP